MLPKLKSPFTLLELPSTLRVFDSSAISPFPTTSSIPANPARIRSSSSESNLPAPLPGDGSSVRTARLSGARGGRAKSSSILEAGDGGIGLIVGVAEAAGRGISVVLAARDREGEKGRGEISEGNCCTSFAS